MKFNQTVAFFCVLAFVNVCDYNCTDNSSTIMDIAVFNPPDVNQSSYLVSDVLFWKSQYKLMATACFEHGRAVEKAMDNTDKYLVRIRQMGTLGKEERRFYKEIKLYQEILRHQMDKLRNDAVEYQDLEKSLKGFSDDRTLRMSKLDNSYKLAKDRLVAQTKVVEEIKKEYHKSMFGIEKATINGMLAISSDVIHDVRAKLEDLEHKAEKQMDTYKRHLDKWQQRFDKLQQLVSDFENAYLTREDARAQKVLFIIQRSIEMTNTSLLAKREPDFSNINGRAIIQEKVITRDVISVPAFEEYIPQEDTSEMYAKARAEVGQDDSERGNASSDAVIDDISKENIEETLAANKKLKHIRKSKLYLVTRKYKKQGVNQINLKVGEYVKQLLPENEDGLAFGEVVHGLLHKKKKGFYPVTHVTLVDNGDVCSDDVTCSDTRGTTAESKTRRKSEKRDGNKGFDINMFDHTKQYDHKNKNKLRQRELNNENETNINDTARRYGKLSPGGNETLRKGPGKETKKNLFNSIAQRLRGKKRKCKTIEVVAEAEPDDFVNADIEHVVTAVQAFVADSGSDADDNDADVYRQRTSQDSGEEMEPVQEEVNRGQQTVIRGNTKARRRRRENAYNILG